MKQKILRREDRIFAGIEVCMPDYGQIHRTITRAGRWKHFRAISILICNVFRIKKTNNDLGSEKIKHYRG